MALCTQDDVEGVLQLDFGDDNEPVVVQLIAAASAAIENFCGRKFESAGYTEELDGGGLKVLQLEHSPVTAVAQVDEDGITLTEGTHYEWYEGGSLARLDVPIANAFITNVNTSGYWTTTRKGVEVTYTAGFATVPADIALMCANLVSAAFNLGRVRATTCKDTMGLKRIRLEGSDEIEFDTSATNPLTVAGLLTADDMTYLTKAGWVNLGFARA